MRLLLLETLSTHNLLDNTIQDAGAGLTDIELVPERAAPSCEAAEPIKPMNLTSPATSLPALGTRCRCKEGSVRRSCGRPPGAGLFASFPLSVFSPLLWIRELRANRCLPLHSTILHIVPLGKAPLRSFPFAATPTLFRLQSPLRPCASTTRQASVRSAVHLSPLRWFSSTSRRREATEDS